MKKSFGNLANGAFPEARIAAGLSSGSSSIFSPANTASATTLRPSSCDITRYRLLFDDWRGYVVSGFSLVAVANLYVSLFGRLRGEIKEEKAETALTEAACRHDP